MTILRRGLKLLPLLILLALPLFYGCSDSDKTSKASAPRSAPEFTLEDVAGNMVSLSELKGKVVLLDFWATWCPPCRESIPHLAKTYNHYKDQGLEVVGVSLDTNIDDLKDYVISKKIPYKVVIGNQQVKVAYGVSSIPRMFLVDRNGVISADYLGFSSSIGDEMEAKIETLLAQ
jgi:thiol-disulfide isomerase/thioredoxin